MKKEYQKTLCDIDIILSNMEILDKEKVPKKLRQLIKDNKLQEYVSNINLNEPLENQNLSDDTKAFLAMLYLNYWCKSDEEKAKLQQTFRENEAKYQKELREKYNPDNIFKKPEAQVQSKPLDNIKQSPQMQMVEYHESWFRKITNKILEFFRRR